MGCLGWLGVLVILGIFLGGSQAATGTPLPGLILAGIAVIGWFFIPSFKKKRKPTERQLAFIDKLRSERDLSECGDYERRGAPGDIDAASELIDTLLELKRKRR